MFKKKKQSGFIALTSVLLFGALILIMGLSMASTSISEQAMTGYEKGGEKAVSAANSCVDIGVSRVKSGEVSYTDIDQYNNINLYLYDDVYCSLSFEKDPDYSYRVKVIGTATTNTGQRSFSHTEYAYVDNHDFIPGLVGYWPMDEGRGHAVYNKASDDRESYLDFNGVDDYVDCGNDESLDIADTITISAWVKLPPTTIQNRIITRAVKSAPYKGYGLITRENNGKTVIDFVPGGADAVNGLYGTSAIDNDVWHHVVGGYNGTNGFVFVDGIEENNAIRTNDLGSIEHFFIGKDYWGFFNGLIDDVRIYNRALSAEEIQDLYNYEYSSKYAIWQNPVTKNISLKSLESETKEVSTGAPD